MENNNPQNTGRDKVIQFLKTSGIFFAGNVLSKIAGLLMLPLYTSKITATDLGLYDLAYTCILIATYALFFEVWTTIMRYMYEAKSKADADSVITTGGIILTLSIILYTCLAVIIAFLFDIEYLNLIYLFGLTYVLAYFSTFVARGFGRNVDFAVSGIISTIVTVISNVVLILIVKMDYSALFIAHVLGGIAQMIYLEVRVGCFKRIRVRAFKKTLFTSMLRFSLPLGVSSICYWVLNSINKIWINALHGSAANGIYAVGTKFSGLVAFAATSFTYAWQGIAYSYESSDEENGLFYTSALSLYTQFILFGVAILIPIINILFPAMVNESYWQARGIVPISLLVAGVNAISAFLGNIYSARKQTKAIFVSTATAAAVNAGLCYPLITYWGIVGACVAMAVGNLVNLGIRAIILKKRGIIKLEFGSQLLPIALIITGSMLFYSSAHIFFNIILIIIAGILFASRCYQMARR